MTRYVRWRLLIKCLKSLDISLLFLHSPVLAGPELLTDWAEAGRSEVPVEVNTIESDLALSDTTGAVLGILTSPHLS